MAQLWKSKQISVYNFWDPHIHGPVW
jgi:hypothetical protein